MLYNKISHIFSSDIFNKIILKKRFKQKKKKTFKCTYCLLFKFCTQRNN